MVELFNQCPKAIRCLVCNCMMRLVEIDKNNQVIYKCPCCGISERKLLLSNRLQEMKIFLNNIDKEMQPKIWGNKKGMSVLYIPNEYLEDIMNKSKELGLNYCMSREPVYGCVDPNTLERPLIGFGHYKYWFEVKIEDGDVE